MWDLGSLLDPLKEWVCSLLKAMQQNEKSLLNVKGGKNIKKKWIQLIF